MTAFVSARFIVGLCVGSALVAAAPAMAQPASSAADTAALSDALRTLSRTPTSIDALLAAGQASLRLDDADAALGFFRRAQTLSPQDARAKAGMGAVMAHQRQPLEALRLFAEAEQAGALSPAYIAERGLAYDLIGDNARAQRDYASALATGANPIVSRRLALSQAMAGDQRAAEATLLPLLQHQDLAAYRTRAFTLAIGGRGDEAVSIAETMLPATLSNRMAPYLRYMPRLTRAQQAAAANLGAFPRAGDIGRDDPQIAAYAATLGVTPVATQQTADARLVPSGPPLGGAGAARSRPTVAAATPAPPPQARPAPAAIAPTPAAPAPAQAPAPKLVQASPTHGPATSGSDVLPERARAMLAQHPELARSGPGPRPEPMPTASPPVASPPVASPPVASPPVAVSPPPVTPTVVAKSEAPAALPPPPTPASPATIAVPPSTAAADPASGPPAPPPVVVATLAEAPPQAATPAPQPAAPPAAAPAPAAPAPRPSLSEAFGDLRAAPTAAAAAPGAGAVDITKIQPRRPTPPPKPAAPKPPPVPSREWVQVATGRSTSALAFDWRRLKKEADGALDKEKPATAEWGRTNRLVIGPFATEAAADKMVARLKDKKIDAFRFTSDEGQDVAPLE